MIKKKHTFRAVLVLTLTVLISSSSFAQVPYKMSYQAVVRDSDDILITNTQVGLQISILEGSVNGPVIYSETQTPTTNDNGLISIEIGGGSGFNAIEWSDNTFFIKSETDPTGGSNYNITGTSQLLSVPYALHAKTADSVTGLDELDPRLPYGNIAGDMQYWNGTEWALVTAGNEGDILKFINNKPTWFGESGGDGTVMNPITGETWMNKNLGATQVATSSTDTDSFGDLYQWGRAADGHQLRTSGATYTLSNTDTPGHSDFIINGNSPYDWRSPGNDNLWQGVSGTNNPCPTGFRLPTSAELSAEQQSWSSNNTDGAFASPLKLPVAGLRDGSNGGFSTLGSIGGYWSSTVAGTSSRYLVFNDSSAFMFFGNRSFAVSVRCIKE